MRGLIRFIALLFLIARSAYGSSTPPLLKAWGDGRRISGTVVDVTGGSVADADVQIFNSATNILVRRLNTGVDGSFLTTLLPPSVY